MEVLQTPLSARVSCKRELTYSAVSVPTQRSGAVQQPLNRNLGMGEQNKNSSIKTSRTGFSELTIVERALWLQTWTFPSMFTPGFVGESESAVELGLSEGDIAEEIKNDDGTGNFRQLLNRFFERENVSLSGGPTRGG